jgi:hypothetical protein
MIASQRDYLGLGEGRGQRRTVTKLEIGFCHLSKCHGIVERCDWDIAAVEDGCPGEVRVYSCSGIETAEGVLTSGSSTDSAGAETCSFFM